MREFGEKYAGDVQAALRGIQREKMGGAEAVGEIDKTTRKRKWVASQETEAASTDMEGSKSVKNGMFDQSIHTTINANCSSHNVNISQEKSWLVNRTRNHTTCTPYCSEKDTKHSKYHGISLNEVNHLTPSNP